MDALPAGAEVEGWLLSDDWLMLKDEMHEGFLIERNRLRDQETSSAAARYRLVEEMPRDSAYAAVLVMWPLYRSSGWSRHYRMLFIASLVMFLVSISLQGGMLYLLLYRKLVSKDGGDPHACMYGIGAADSFFIPTGYFEETSIGRGFGGLTVTDDNRETDFGRYELQDGIYNSLVRIIHVVRAMMANNTAGSSQVHLEDAMKAVSKVEPKVFGIETHGFRFMGVFLFVVQWCIDFWTSTVHFYIGPCWANSMQGGSWIQRNQNGDVFRFAGYQLRKDCFVIGLLAVLSLVVSFFTLLLGIDMLLSLTTAEDVLLNCLALTFILDIDEIVFRSFAPIEVRNILNDLDLEFYHQSNVWPIVQTLRCSPWLMVLTPILVPLIISIGCSYLVLFAHCTYNEELGMYVSRFNGEG